MNNSEEMFSEEAHNGVRYRYGVADETWMVVSLPVDRDGCDGLCTYGCGADPWKIEDYGMSDEPTRADAHDALRAILDRKGALA